MPPVTKKKKAARVNVGAAGRKTAPKNISVTDEWYQDESTIILNKAKAALGEETASGMEFAYGSPAPHTADSLKLQGWVPVTTRDNDKTKEWRHKADPLLMRPIGQKEHEIAVSSAVAREQLSDNVRANSDDLSAPH